MWTYKFERKVDLNPEQLWLTLADIAGWPKLDSNIEFLEINAPPAVGIPFVLKPKGGPKLQFEIGLFEAPERYSDICKVPLGKMHTRHTLEPDGDGTLIKVDIEIEGPLSRLWGFLVGRKHASGLPAQTDRFVEGARNRLSLQNG